MSSGSVSFTGSSSVLWKHMGDFAVNRRINDFWEQQKEFRIITLGVQVLVVLVLIIKVNQQRAIVIVIMFCMSRLLTPVKIPGWCHCVTASVYLVGEPSDPTHRYPQ